MTLGFYFDSPVFSFVIDFPLKQTRGFGLTAREQLVIWEQAQKWNKIKPENHKVES